MKIMIDDDYYIDENGNKYYSGNIAEEKYENNMISQCDVQVNNTNFKNDDVYSNERLDSFSSQNNEVNNNHIDVSNYESFNDINVDNDEYSYYGYNCSCQDEIKGSITVHSRLGNKDGIELKGAKINLYVLNGVSPRLLFSKVTDIEGKVIFDNLEDGCYRIIAIIDRKYFEKPCYITWNEVTIDSCCKEASIIVVNKIKGSCSRR